MHDPRHWDAYRLFLAAADAGSLSAAAARLGVSQPTMSRQLAALERRLGSRLFDRRPNGLELTTAGRRILAGARDLENRAQALDLLARGEDRNLGGTVVISATEGFATATLAPRLVALRRELPDIAIELSIAFELVDVLRGDADVVFRHTRPGSGELVGRRIAHVGYGLWASEAYLATRAAPRHTADLAKHTIIQPSGPLERIPQAVILRRWAARAATISCSTMPGCAALAHAGAGIACLPRHLAEATPGLRRVLAGKADWTSPLWMLSRRELVRTARVRAVMDRLGESYRDARL